MEQKEMFDRLYKFSKAELVSILIGTIKATVPENKRESLIIGLEKEVVKYGK